MIQEITTNQLNLDQFFTNFLNASNQKFMIAIPIALTVIILALGFIIGFFRGILGFLTNLISITTGFLLGLFLAEPILLSIKKKLPIDNFYSVHFNVFKPLTVPFVILGMIIIASIVGEIVYWCLRPLLLKPMKMNKKTHKSNALHRSLGATLGVVSMVPVIILTTNATAFLSHSNVYTDFNDKLIKGMTFNKGSGISAEMSLLKSGLKLYLEKDDNKENGVKKFTSLISSVLKMKPEEQHHLTKNQLEQSKVFMKDILNSKTGEQFISNFINKFAETNKNFDASTILQIDENKVKENIQKLDGGIKGVSKEGIENYKNSVKKVLGDKYKNDAELKKQVDEKIDLITNLLFI
ncbi:hypothetical protein ACJA25_02800 [Mycoplasmopsis hyopharyngis]|uniref:hypothetical protein n=1 Tax=Mycoplasmopsis hyopharyngis TaxID=29558 RepID=UPI003872FC48